MNSPLLPTYARADVAFERGEGPWLMTRDGERYLDFGGGIAVNVLGHAHPHLVAALTEQAGKLWHTSNLFRIPEGERLAQRLVDNTFADLVFFTNSGAEALEASIKMARKYHSANGEPERFRILTFEGAFHGRTLATIAAGGQKKYLEGFGPKVEGFDQVPFGDHEALRRAITPRDRRHPDRAGAGRGRHPQRPDAMPARPARALRRTWHAPRLRRGADRRRAHRQAVRA